MIFTLFGAAGQTARNAMQRELTPRLGALGATLVRFLFGFPFALLFLAAAMLTTRAALPAMTPAFAGWTVLGAITQIGGTALMLLTMEHRSFVVTVAYLKAEPILVAIMGLVFLGDRLTRHDYCRDPGRHGGRRGDLDPPGSADRRRKARLAGPVVSGAVRGFPASPIAARSWLCTCRAM